MDEAVMKKTLLFVLMASVSVPASANTYARVTAGAAIDHPDIRDFERRCSRPNPKTGACNIWHSRVVSDTEAPTVEAAVGKDFGAFRIEANSSYVRVGANEAGCPDCNTAYTPDKQVGATDIVTGTINALGDLPVTNKLTLSAGAGVGVAYYAPHTAYPGNGGWRQKNASTSEMWRLVAEARYRVSNRLEAGLRWTREDLGSRRVDFGDRNHTLSSVNEPVRYHTATAGLTYNFGG